MSGSRQLLVQPSSLRFGQATIKHEFGDERQFTDLALAILRRRVDIHDIPAIQVTKNSKGKLVAYNGNRRLFVYKYLELLALPDFCIPVEFKPWKRFDTVRTLASVVVRRPQLRASQKLVLCIQEEVRRLQQVRGMVSPCVPLKVEDCSNDGPMQMEVDTPEVCVITLSVF